MKQQGSFSFPPLARDVCLIVSVTLLSSIVFNSLRQNGVYVIPKTIRAAGFHRVDVLQAKDEFDAGAVFVDARPAEEYRVKHVKGALNVPLALFDFAYRMKLGHLDRQRELVIYGRSISTLYDEEVAVELLSRGHTNIMVMVEDLDGWSKRGYPCEP